jgi:hypothetical protein
LTLRGADKYEGVNWLICADPRHPLSFFGFSWTADLSGLQRFRRFATRWNFNRASLAAELLRHRF